jgi:AcrR family transcriptional regulator
MTNLLNPQKHADQRTRLLAHARHLFAMQGIKETSMSQVAKACKVTKATLYHYFKSKDAILKEILDCRSKTIEATAQGSRAQNLEECLDQIARSHLKQMDEPENLELIKIMISETMKNHEMRKFYMEFLKENIGMGAQAVTPFIQGKKNEKEMRLLFFQFMSTLVHYDWNVKMVGDPSGFIGGEEAFIRQLVKTYTLAFQAG